MPFAIYDFPSLSRILRRESVVSKVEVSEAAPVRVPGLPYIENGKAMLWEHVSRTWYEG